MFSLLKWLFVSEHERDVQAYMSRVEEINKYSEEYQSLTNDELRQKTFEFRERIATYLSEIDEELENLREQAIKESDFEEKEILFNELDDLEEDQIGRAHV